jgi:RNA polymerase sigma-70 factor (ECF subfamily)
METPTDSTTRDSLLLRIRDAGRHEDWKTFVDLYTPLVFNCCRRRGLQAADAEDVTQRVFVKMSRKLCDGTFDYQPGKGRFRGYLYQVARNEINDVWEAARRGGRAVSAADAPELLRREGPAEDPEWQEEYYRRLLQVALQRIRADFDDRTWEIFERTWVVDAARGKAAESNGEVARRLGVPRGVVDAAKFRVLHKLQEMVLFLADDPDLFEEAARGPSGPAGASEEG